MYLTIAKILRLLRPFAVRWLLTSLPVGRGGDPAPQGTFVYIAVWKLEGYALHTVVVVFACLVLFVVLLPNHLFVFITAGEAPGRLHCS